MSVMQDIVKEAAPGIIVLVGSVISALCGMLAKYLHDRGQSAKGFEALAVLTDLMSAGVAVAKADIAPKLAAALANDGKVDEAEWADMKATAIADLKRLAPKAAIQAAEKLLGSSGLTTWLEGMAEKLIGAPPVKTDAPVADPPKP